MRRNWDPITGLREAEGTGVVVENKGVVAESFWKQKEGPTL